MKRLTIFLLLLLGLGIIATARAGKVLSAQREDGIKWLQKADSTDSLTLKIEYYTKAIKTSPEDELLYVIFYNRGKCWVALNNLEKALNDFDKTIEIATKLNLKDGIHYYARGSVYCILKKYKEAISDFTKGIERCGRFMDVYYFTDQEAREIIDTFTKAIELNPKDASLYYERGIMYYVINYFTREQENALKDFSTAIELNPNYALAYLGRGLAYFNHSYKSGEMMKEQIKGVEDFTKAIKLNPGYSLFYSEFIANFYFNQGEIYEKKEDQKAIEFYTKAIEFNPREDRYYSARAHVYYRLGLYDKSIQDYTRVIELRKPGDPYFPSCEYFLRGECYEKLKEYQKALDDYNKVIIHGEKDDWWQFNSRNARARIYVLLGEYQKALSEYEKMSEKDYEENLVRVDDKYYWSAFANYKLKNYREALKQINKFLEMELAQEDIETGEILRNKIIEESGIKEGPKERFQNKANKYRKYLAKFRELKANGKFNEAASYSQTTLLPAAAELSSAMSEIISEIGGYEAILFINNNFSDIIRDGKIIAE